MPGAVHAVLAPDNTYYKLINLLDAGLARYHLIDHEPAGPTALASQARGHPLEQAAKCIVLRIRVGKSTIRYALAVVPGDCRVNSAAVKRLYGGTSISFAPMETAEKLAGCVSGTIIPFSFNAELDLIADPGLFAYREMFFNAARLDQSVALYTQDYLAIGKPRVADIASLVVEPPLCS